MTVKHVALILFFMFVFSGCTPVKPWERDILAQDKMKLDPNPVETALDEHIYFSKEAASGGQGVGGGGCGCN
ncbi:DUF4266 domain-containing protein [Kaarinaea lacus]